MPQKRKPKKKPMHLEMTRADIAAAQAMPLAEKILLAERNIRQWYTNWEGKVYVAFSGGKDSTVVLHLARRLYPDIPAFFFDTGLEFPEIREFVKTFDGVTFRKPVMTFREVISRYGYPIPSKEVAIAISRYNNTKDPKQKYYRLHGFPNGPKGMIPKKWQYLLKAPFKISGDCCDCMKKNPGHKIEREFKLWRLTGEMAGDSFMRMRNLTKNGCNAFHLKSPVSRPIAMWTEEDIWAYIRQEGIPYASVYDMGYERTGCMFCGFGVCQEKSPNRFQLMRQTHPKLWKYCMEKLGMKRVLDFVGVPIE